jgi:hypothetical protein
MKSILVVLLGIAAFLWTVFHYMERLLPTTKATPSTSSLNIPAQAQLDSHEVLSIIKRDSSGKDPFHSDLRKPVKKRQFRASTPTPKIISKPPITINTIMPGPIPVVIFNYQNSTKLIKSGQQILGWTLESVQKNTVTLTKDGETITITKGIP